jgi:chemotaxis protein CheD
MSAILPRTGATGPLQLPLVGESGAHYVLHPGDVVTAGAGATLETLLGSCVAIVLTDPRRTTGSMCHIVHSGRGRHADDDTTHGEPAIRRMYADLRARAIEPRLCHAFIFGGGNMFPQLYERGTHIGEQNAEWAARRLARDGVRVLYCDVGGTQYRRVRWTVGHEMPDVRGTTSGKVPQ